MLNGSGAAIALEAGRIKVDAEGRTSLAKVWAGGDCVFGGDDLTVAAVAQGRDAAESIHRALMGCSLARKARGTMQVSLGR